MQLLRDTERTKYATIWSSIPEYRDFSPGKENVERFMSIMKPRQKATVIDIGCGTGIAGQLLKQEGLDSWWLDITDAGLSPDIPRDRFIQSTLWMDWKNAKGTFHSRWDYGFCCDVMEHLPPEYVMISLDRILASCETVWFQICNDNDLFGASIGEPLHLTVRPFVWWKQQFKELGALVIEARDLQGVSLFIVGR